MRILVYSESFFPNMGGLERNTFTLASTLAELGHEPVVLTGTLDTDGKNYPFRVVRKRDYKAFFSEIKNTELIIINGGIALKVCIIALFLRKNYMPIYVTSNLFVSEERSLSAYLGTHLRKFIAKNAKMNIALSQFAKEQLMALLPNRRTIILPNPIDGELEEIFFKKSQTPPQKVYDILFAGRMIEGKGIFILIDALKKIGNSLTLNVAFAGDGSDANRLLEYAKAQNIKITYLGRLESEEIIDTYLKSRALIVPSSTHIEGNPLVIAEAISIGLPIVASNQEAMIEAVGNAGYIFKSGDAGDLADKIILLFKKDNLLEKTQNTLIRKQEFSYKRYKNNVEQTLKQVLIE